MFKLVNEGIKILGEKEENIDSGESKELGVGIFKCPNEKCDSVVFVAWVPGIKEVAVSYPPERINFDCRNIVFWMWIFIH